MAHYRLTAPHWLELGPPHRRIPQLVEAGAVIDTAQLPAYWTPTPACVPLDADAEAALLAECTRIRSAHEHPRGLHGAGAVPGFGPLHRHPGGDLHGKPPNQG